MSDRNPEPTPWLTAGLVAGLTLSGAVAVGFSALRLVGVDACYFQGAVLVTVLVFSCGVAWLGKD